MAPVLQHPPTSRSMRSASGVAAPLFAAACVTVIGVIVQQPGSLAYSSAALALLVSAAILLTASVQAGFWADYAEPTPLANGTVSLETPPMSDEEYNEAVAYYQRYRLSVSLARRTYGAGVALLWLGVAAELIRGTSSHGVG